MGNQKEEIGIDVTPEVAALTCPACEATARLHQIMSMPSQYHASCCFCDWSLTIADRVSPVALITQAECDATLANPVVAPKKK